MSGALDTGKARRPFREQRRVNVDFPAWMIESLDREAGRLGVTRQSIIKEGLNPPDRPWFAAEPKRCRNEIPPSRGREALSVSAAAVTPEAVIRAEIAAGKYEIAAKRRPPPGRYRVSITANREAGRDVVVGGLKGSESELFTRETEGLAAGSWVVIDEIQKVPALLDEVHRLMESRRLRFVLAGSSARKLRRGGTNLRAGRADVRHRYPLVSAEVGDDAHVERMIELGSLPLAVTGADPRAFLKSYALTYLQEEIRAEALTRTLGGFARFLEIAARQNAQVTNVAGIARDAGVSRQSVQNWFDILVDTLLGSWLPAWKLKRATKQTAHPKFDLFDSGVARALSGRLPYPPLPEERGALLETLIHKELSDYLEYSGLGYPLSLEDPRRSRSRFSLRNPEGIYRD